MKVVWSNEARHTFRKAILWIREESPQNARLVKKAVFEKLTQASSHPTRFPLDSFKTNNDGSFRAFETHSFRLAYRFDDHELRILYFRHVHQNPKKY